MAYQIKTSLLFIIIALVMICIPKTSCRPNGESPGATTVNIEREEGYEDLSDRDYIRVKPCIFNMATMELCMRCAKVTKSTIVYPMCCSNEDTVLDWCREYIYYGSTS
ncbi:unnamed protein product [Hermetia illucens]|uniref:Uncharacterized protein n=1 Tax=Hermetia illucens TaxID=343691 RepID=A0A7R8YYX1_HERIL|nr:uncharacterized protein LOC119655844 [Hermetia illucens]CAD7089417.1 unnamed protein product [Hermetia illucens]